MSTIAIKKDETHKFECKICEKEFEILYSGRTCDDESSTPKENETDEAVVVYCPFCACVLPD